MKKNGNGRKSPFPNFSVKITYRQLSIQILVSEQDYQKKELNFRVINSIIKNFDPHKLGTIRVSLRNGKYYVFDGQHRLTALKIMYPDGDYFVWCEIHEGVTYEGEARLFREQNDNKSALTAYHRFNAALEERDPATIEISNTLTSLGLSISKTKSGKSDNEIRCVRVITDLHKKHTIEDFTRILWLVKSSWGGVYESLDGRIICGVAIFYETYNGEFDENYFIKYFSQNAKGNSNPKEIIALGSIDRHIKGNLKYAKVIFDIYNSGKRGSNKLPYKFKG